MSMVTVRIPAALRSYTDGAAELAADGVTVADVLNNLADRHDGLVQRVLTPEGQLRRFVNIFLDGDRIGTDGRLDQPLREGDVLAIIPAVAGG